MKDRQLFLTSRMKVYYQAGVGADAEVAGRQSINEFSKSALQSACSPT